MASSVIASVGSAVAESPARLLPLELIDKCVGSRLWVVMKNEREYVGTLRGFVSLLVRVLARARLSSSHTRVPFHAQHLYEITLAG